VFYLIFLQHHLWDRTNKTRAFVSEKLPILFLKIPPLFMPSFPLRNHSAAVFHCHRCFVHHLRCHSKHSRSSPPLTIVVVDATAVRLPEWGDASYNAASHPPPRPTGPTTSGAPTRLLSCLLLLRSSDNDVDGDDECNDGDEMDRRLDRLRGRCEGRPTRIGKQVVGRAGRVSVRLRILIASILFLLLPTSSAPQWK
jgi:hypothetical protein